MPLPGGRRKAREIVFRVLFETELSREDPLETLEYAFARYRLTEDGRAHALRLLQAWLERREAVDRTIADHLTHWDPARLSGTVRAILRLAVSELWSAPDVHARVILDESVELAKKYGEPSSDAFVNGVLDPIAGRFRPGEVREKPDGPGR